MIYTRFGSIIKAIKRETEGLDWILCEREDGSERCYLLQDLKADKGLREILEAIKEA